MKKLMLSLIVLLNSGIVYGAPKMPLRGFNIETKSPETIISAAQQGAQVLRWQMFPCLGKAGYTPGEYIIAVIQEMTVLDAMLPTVKEHGLVLILDLHVGPGSSSPSKEPWVSTFMQAWSIIAEHYKDEPAIYGYGLLNEPHYKSNDDWLRVVRSLNAVIRQHNPNKKLIVSAGINGSQAPSFPSMKTSGVIDMYEFHMYEPMSFTHQGLPSRPAINKTYKPGAAIKVLAKVRDWQRKNGNPPILLGEFSCVRWAPGNSCYNYLKDVVNTANKYGWSWTYHSWRNAGTDVWRLDVPARPVAATEADVITDRLLMMRQALTGAQVK